MNNFTFYSPTYFVFGKDEENNVGKHVKRFGGTKVLIHYGGGSVVRSGLLDRVKASLEAEGIAFVTLGGVKPNPRSGLVYEGIELCRKEKVDFILAVGGGSVIDATKAIALLASNPGILLSTVRSRCAEAHLSPLEPQELLRALHDRCPGHTEGEYQFAAATGYLGQAIARLEQPLYSEQTAAFAAAFAARDSLQLLELLVPMEKWKRDQLIPVLGSWIALMEEALACRSGMRCLHPMTEVLASRRSSQELMEGIRHIQKAIVYTQANVSVAAVCGYLQWVLR